jgi:hypothetical protein
MSESVSRSRPQSATYAPSFRNLCSSRADYQVARARPIPLLEPVISTRFSAKYGTATVSCPPALCCITPGLKPLNMLSTI